MDKLLCGIEEVLLMGPGPSSVPQQVYDAIASKTLGHLDPYFISIMDEVKKLLQLLMHTENDLTIPISGTGSAGMETCFVNLVEPGDAVLILINGVFGMRMKDVAERLGAEVDTLEFEWGRPVEPDILAVRLKEKQYKIVAVVHAETSTGVENPVVEIGGLVKESGALYLLDAVTSLGGIPIAADAWGVDALYSGSQKCLSCPPGLAPVSFSKRAYEVIAGRKRKVPNWYLDLTMITKYWGGQKRAYHHTAPINMIYALYQALAQIRDEGLEAVFERHKRNHEFLVKGLQDLGIEMLVEPAYRLPMLNSVKIPDGADDVRIRKRLLQEHKIEIGAGLGPLAGKIWRIGLMGHVARKENVQRLLKALAQVL
jgi:alanine-glyoxylate transaminase/serine-glyoxylate transaminase/serine-pyruvate transaminase